MMSDGRRRGVECGSGYDGMAMEMEVLCRFMRENNKQYKPRALRLCSLICSRCSN